MQGHEAQLDGFRVTAWETEGGLPRLVVLAKSSEGKDVPLGLDWTVEHLAGAVGRLTEEEFVGLVGSAVLTDIHSGVSR